MWKAHIGVSLNDDKLTLLENNFHKAKKELTDYLEQMKTIVKLIEPPVNPED